MDREVQRAIQKKHRRDQKRKTKLAKKQSLMLDKILIKTVANANSNSNNIIHNNRIHGSTNGMYTSFGHPPPGVSNLAASTKDAAKLQKTRGPQQQQRWWIGLYMWLDIVISELAYI